MNISETEKAKELEHKVELLLKRIHRSEDEVIEAYESRATSFLEYATDRYNKLIRRYKELTNEDYEGSKLFDYFTSDLEKAQWLYLIL